MSPHIRTLAGDGAMAWSLVFDPTELHVYIGLAAGAEMPTIEDFLTILPKDRLQRQAHDRLVSLLQDVIGNDRYR